ncbi:MAG: hypothetical protein KatS3mg114_0094 [Planctomycetaceae bacterium]|nr:MAG: hypothetical protein KatS3mg114_0094 [Planctomycetaceae bacterium]
MKHQISCLRGLRVVDLLMFLWLAAKPLWGQDMPLTQILLDGEDWREVSQGHRFTEAPATNRQGEVFFVDVPASRLWKIRTDGQVELFAENTGKASGLMFDNQGRLFACQSETQRVVWYDTEGKSHLVAEGIAGNDLAVDRWGGVYVTDMKGRRLWYVNATGESRVVAEGFTPNGVILWPDGGTLVVADWDEPYLWAWRIEKTGDLRFGAPYYRPVPMPPRQEKPGSDGLTVDDAGRVYLCCHAGLAVFDPTGRLSGVIAKPQNQFLSNVTFGGSAYDTLYVTCTDKVYARKTSTRGTPHAWWNADRSLSK